MPSYLLHVDDLPVGSAESFEEAKSHAATYLQSKLPLRIESLVAPAPSRTWVYDYELDDWAEQR